MTVPRDKYFIYVKGISDKIYVVNSSDLYGIFILLLRLQQELIYKYGCNVLEFFSISKDSLNVLIMSRTRLRVNPHCSHLKMVVNFDFFQNSNYWSEVKIDFYRHYKHFLHLTQMTWTKITILSLRNFSMLATGMRH